MGLHKMPTYEYACRSCGTHIEVVQSFSDDPLTTCEACGGSLRKVIHPSGILFKGSGFYSTDRRATIPQPRSRKETDKAAGSKDGAKKAASDKKDKPAAAKESSSKKSAEKSA